MLLMLGWSGALLVGLAALVLVVTWQVSPRVNVCHIAGMFLLALYGALRRDYPVLALAGTGLVIGIVSVWRQRRYGRRTAHMKLACESFARAQRAARAAFGTQLR